MAELERIDGPARPERTVVRLRDPARAGAAGQQGESAKVRRTSRFYYDARVRHAAWVTLLAVGGCYVPLATAPPPVALTTRGSAGIAFQAEYPALELARLPITPPDPADPHIIAVLQAGILIPLEPIAWADDSGERVSQAVQVRPPLAPTLDLFVPSVAPTARALGAGERLRVAFRDAPSSHSATPILSARAPPSLSLLR